MGITHSKEYESECFSPFYEGGRHEERERERERESEREEREGQCKEGEY
jgi:hypothetical protein